MKINAKYFGSLSYDPEDLIYLPDGLFGFESYKNFLPLPFPLKFFFTHTRIVLFFVHKNAVNNYITLYRAVKFPFY